MVDTASSEPQHWLAETKFHPPLLREDILLRQHLLDELYKGLASRPLTLISAPAGYGKTTLLSALAHARSDFPLAWLSLDEDDNDPARFLSAMIAALQRLHPDCGATAQTLLIDPANPGAGERQVVSVLINDVLDAIADPFVLVLDDLHIISEPSIYIALEYLIEHLPPQMHLVVSSRLDPPLALARLRARGQVAEFRLAELRFSDEEAGAFLNERLDLGLSPPELALLQSTTEGWAVGLRLLASSLARINSTGDRQRFIQHLAQSDRYIFNFLAEEVFNHQEEEIRTFMLETAILPFLTPRLCQAVTRRTGAGSMLEELYRRNLFLVQVSPIGEGRNLPIREPRFERPQLQAGDLEPEIQYRYHDLFAWFLLHKLEEEWPERLPDLHFRAARAESDPARAVSHYLAANRWDEAAEMIERIGAEMFSHGYTGTLSRWINALPASVREGRPRLLHYLSHCAFLKGSADQVQSLLERALQGFEAAGDQAGQGEVLADLATAAVWQGDVRGSIPLHTRALTYPIPPHTRVQALLGRALAQGVWGNQAQTERDFKAAMSIVLQSPELDPLYLVTFPFFHPEFAFLPGGLEDLERLCRQAKALVGDQVSPSRLMVEEMRTALYLFQGQLDGAIRTGESALSLRKRLGGHPYLSDNAALFLMIAYAARGDYAAVEPLFDTLFLGVDQTVHPVPDLPIYLFYAGRVRWLQGRLPEARQIYAQMCSLQENNPIREALELRICYVWMRGLLDLAQGRYAQAESALRQPEVLEQKDNGSTVHGDTRLMLARLYWAQDRREEAMAELAPVLAYHQQLGLPFAILVEGQSVVPLLRQAVKQGLYEGYAAHLLGLLGAHDERSPVKVPSTGQTLTPREVEVLSQIVQGDSNRTIAERLVITESTVKTHVYHIFAKLDVSSRTEAAARTRDLGLL